MAERVIRIMCPNLTCRTVLGVPVAARGKTVKCRACGAMLKVPAKAAEPSPPPPEAGGKDAQKAA